MLTGSLQGFCLAGSLCHPPTIEAEWPRGSPYQAWALTQLSHVHQPMAEVLRAAMLPTLM